MPVRFFSNPYFEFLIRLLIACACGAVIGTERMRRHKEAGIRTHIIVAMGAALFVIISKYGFSDLADVPGAQVDVARVASNVVTGVSFLGAGIISMKGDIVKGLTTAAGVWATAAIGMSIGVGMYELGISGTLLIMIVQFVLHQGKGYGLDKMVTSRIVVSMEDNPEHFNGLRKLLKSKGISITNTSIKRGKHDTITYTLDIFMPKNILPEDLLSYVKEYKNIKSVGV